MEDKYEALTEYAPVWKRIDPANPPKAMKALFKSDFGSRYPRGDKAWRTFRQPATRQSRSRRPVAPQCLHLPQRFPVLPGFVPAFRSRHQRHRPYG